MLGVSVSLPATLLNFCPVSIGIDESFNGIVNESVFPMNLSDLRGYFK